MDDLRSRTRELSWSLSRARLFGECPRRFYYANYFAKLARFDDAPETARLAAEMARIKGLDMWAGEIVHGTIQWALERIKDGSIPSEEEAKAETRRRMSEGWLASVKGLWRTHQDDACPNLFEHYYNIPVLPALTDRIKNKAFLCITNFVESELFDRIKSMSPDLWLPIEKYASFRLDGLLFYVKFDFAIKDQKNITVYDWKTGNPTEAENRQLACYALYAAGRWDVPIDNIRVCPVHLQPVLEAPVRQVDDETVEEMRLYVRKSFNAMVSCLRDPARNIAAMDDFPMTENIPRCIRCNFRGICTQGQQATGEIENPPMTDDWEA